MQGKPHTEHPRPMTETRSSNISLVMLVLAGIAFSILVGLGTWQWNRLIEKEALIELINTRIIEPPVPLDAIIGMADAGTDIEYRPVKLTGRLMNEREQYVLATYEGQSGWHVYTPVEVDGGQIIFVNRGFVPYDKRDPSLREDGQMNQLVNIEGLARAALTVKPGFMVPDNAPDKNEFYWKDLNAMILAADLEDKNVLPFFVDKTSKLPEGLIPIAGVTRIDLPNNHLQYLITWYGLALALAGVLLAYILKSRRKAA
jgi:surfeit locus 1 family protein